MSFVHSLLCLLCACFTPPLCALCRPSELCVHLDPSVTTSQLFSFFTSIWNLSLTSCPTMRWQFDPLSSQVMEFYNSEQRAKLWELSGIVPSVRKSWPHVTTANCIEVKMCWPSLKGVLTKCVKKTIRYYSTALVSRGFNVMPLSKISFCTFYCCTLYHLTRGSYEKNMRG